MNPAPDDRTLTFPHDRISPLVRQLLVEMGEDPDRAGLAATPRRVAESMRSLTSGYEQTLEEVVGGALFEENYSEIISVQDIEVYSLCEHHLLPFFGRAHVAYIPNGKILGLSKLPRIVDIFARRLQMQERMTTQVADALQQVLSPRGVAVVIEAQHLCMMMRGVSKQNSRTVTSSMLGIFRESHKTRSEFLSLLARRGTPFPGTAPEDTR